ncbi:MAG: hypothetical protein AB7Q17_15710 [Phycisphaerae bacterium]
MRLAEQLRELIRRDGRTLKAISIAGGPNPAQLSRFMRGERCLSIDSLQKLLDALEKGCRFERAAGGRKTSTSTRPARRPAATPKKTKG